MQEKVDIQQTKPAAPSEPFHSAATVTSPHTLSELLQPPPLFLRQFPPRLLPASARVHNIVLGCSGREFALRGGGGADILPPLHSRTSLLTGAAERIKFS